jgi:hypothetical protein
VGRSDDHSTTSLSLHGLATVAIEGARPSDIAVIRRQLGPLPDGVSDTPDLTVRFVDRLAETGPLRHVGLEAAHDEDRFVVLKGRRKTSVRVELPLEQLGVRPVVIVAERGLGAVPFLLPVLNVLLLAKGVVPVHASAFVHDGRGVLVTGWAKGGKSEALLAFADRGATYVGDEWVYLLADGSAMGGLPEPMRLWDWQLGMVPRIRARVGISRRARLGAAAALSTGLSAVSATPGIRSSAVGDLSRRTGAIVDRQRSVQVAPARLFAGRMSAGLVPLDTVILIESSTSPAATVEAITSATVATQTAATVRHELLDLEALYLAFRFAFPDRRNALIESLPELLEARLATAFAAPRCLLVRHPYPPDIAALYDLIEPALDHGRP